MKGFANTGIHHLVLDSSIFQHESSHSGLPRKIKKPLEHCNNISANKNHHIGHRYLGVISSLLSLMDTVMINGKQQNTLAFIYLLIPIFVQRIMKGNMALMKGATEVVKNILYN